MRDLNTLPIVELERICDQDMVRLYRNLIKDPQAYREAILGFLNQPKFPFDDWFAVMRAGENPYDAWKKILDICQKAAPGAPWSQLPTPDLNRDVELAAIWLKTELDKLPEATGIYLGLDTLNMKNGRRMNVGIGGTTDCDPMEDSSDWLESKLTYGRDHLIRGLLELKQEYSKSS